MLDPSTLPPVNILGLAQSGTILRAERETLPDGIPAFITKAGWDELTAAHNTSAALVLSSLEKAVARLLAHAAEDAQTNGRTAPVISLESDLFPSDPTLILTFVRDETHPVACALLGTASHLTEVLKKDASV